MVRPSLLALLGVVGSMSGAAYGQSLHAMGGISPVDVSDNGVSIFGTQSRSTPCVSGTSVFRINLGNPITFGNVGTGQSNVTHFSRDGSAAVGSIANGTTLTLSPTSTTATIVQLWNGATWAPPAGIFLPTVAAGPTTAPVSQGNCSGSATTAYDISGDGNTIAGSTWVFGGPSTTTGSASGCWHSTAFVYDRAANTFTNLGNPATVNATTPVTYTAGGSTRVNALNDDGTIAVGWDTESTGQRMPVVWYKNGTTWTKVFLNTVGAPNRGGEAFAVNSWGTIIVGTSADYPGRWVRWDRGFTADIWQQAPVGQIPADQPSWFAGTGYDALRISQAGSTNPAAVSTDGSIITGFAAYRNGSSVAQFGMIWRTGMWAPLDARDYLATVPALSTPMSKLPMDTYGAAYVSANGQTVAMAQPGFVVGKGIMPTLLRVSDAPVYTPVVTLQPCGAAVNNCSSLLSPTLRAAFAGTVDESWTVQWYKRGPLNDGSDDFLLNDTDLSAFGNGTGYYGSQTPTLRIGNASSFEFGSYYCRATNSAGSVSTNIVTISGPTLATNTTCGTASAIAGALPTYTQTVDFCSAYGSDGVFVCGNVPQTYQQLWYTFTPTQTGDYRINACAVAPTNVVSVYDSCANTNTPLACSTGSNNASQCSSTTTKGYIDRIALTAGSTYYIRVAPRATTAQFSGNGSFTVTLAPAVPANDGCAGATSAVVGQNPFDTSNSTTDGTASCGNNAGGASGKDVWFKFTPPTSNNYRLSTCNGTTNPPFDTVLSIYTGSCGSLAELDCNNDFQFASGSPVLCTSANASRFERIALTGGTEYFIRIAGMPNASASNAGANVGSGAGSMSLAIAPPLPANDECSASVDITSGSGNLPFNSPSTVDIAEATPQDPVASPLGMSCQVNARRDVWYRFTTPSVLPANPLRIQVCGQTSSIDFTLALYDGCPDMGGVEIAGACADNIGGNGTASCVFNAPRLDRITLLPSTTYYVRVAGSFTSRGNAGTLSVAAAPDLPANDNCTGALPVTVTPAAAAGATISTTAYTLDEATTDPTFTITNCAADTTSTGTATSRDLWYSFTPPCTTAYTIQTCGSTQSEPILHVFSGCSAPTLLACNDNVGSGVTGCSFSQSRISNLSLTAGVPVLIRVANTGTARPGNVVGSLTITQGMVCQVCCRGATCTLVLNDCVAAGTAGAAIVAGPTTCNAGGSATTPCCYADYDKVNGSSVADIFAFLTDWFAASPFTIVGGSGAAGTPTVSHIFAFLTAWFAGC